jgi:phasin family protein
MQTQEQFAATQKATLDMLFSVTNGIVVGVEKLVQLNMQTIRSTLDDTLDQAQKALSVKEPQEWPALQSSLAAPTAEKMQAYGRQLFEIGAAIQAEFKRLAHAQWEASDNRARTLVEEVAKNAPAGSEAAVAALDSTMTAVNALYETLEKTGQQAVEATRSNLDVAAAAAAKTAKRAIEPATQAAKR